MEITEVNQLPDFKGYAVMNGNVLRRARLVKRIVDEYYQPQSHKGCMLDIYRHQVMPRYPMSVATFWRYMRYAIAEDGYVGNGSNRVARSRTPKRGGDPPGQLSMF